MNSLIPIGALRRDEIYSFIGGFFIAGSWYIYFTSLPNNTNISGIELVTSATFLLSWLLSTAILFTIQLLLGFIIAVAIKYWLKGKTQIEKQKVLNLPDPVENFMAVEFVNDVKTNIHIIGIIITAVPLSLFPLYELSRPFITHNMTCLILVLIVMAYTCLLFFFIKFWKWFVVIHILKADGSVEIIDQNTYAQERAAYIAKVKNEQSKQKVQNYLDQQNRGQIE